MGDVFLLGAGFSRAVSQAMPLLRDLSQEVRNRTPDFVNIDRGSLFADDIEMWLTYLSQDHPWLSEAKNLRNRALFLDLSRAIREVLEERMKEAIQGEHPKWFSRLIEWWHEKKASVVTLNYDTLVERCAVGMIQRLKCSDIYPTNLTPAGQRVAGVTAGDAIPSFRLFKLHGSINWYYSGSSSFFGETIYYVPLRGTWDHPGDEKENKDERLLADKVPFIVPPLMEKVLYFQHETLRSLWSQAAEALRGATRVFCLGYSLPSTDITMRFFLHGNRTASHVKFYVGNTDDTTYQHFRCLLPDCYEVDARFVGASSIPRLVDALDREDLDVNSAVKPKDCITQCPTSTN